MRETESKRVTQKIFAWLIENKTKARAQSKLAEAITYTLKRWEGLTQFLSDTRIALISNDVERTIRHAVMGKKNFYGSQTINGADVTATLYTVIESCKKVELDPKSYLKMSITKSAQGEKVPTPMQYAKSIRT